MNKNGLYLPDKLETYREQFEKSIKPYLNITGKKMATLPWESKIGGNPYMPDGFKYPLDKWNKPMRLLSQINFEEAPHIEPYPHKGILQFYITSQDDLYGMDHNNLISQENFRVVYFSEIKNDETKLITDFSFIGEPKEYCIPFEDEVKLFFDIKYQAVSTGDFQFEKIFGSEALYFLEEVFEDEGEVENFFENFSSPGSRIGGYAYFTQYDPRGINYDDYTQLLLQIDSENSLGVMWGDSGIGNFFICEQDLKNLDFSKVLYNWDCC